MDQQIAFYEAKLAYEMDSADLFDALNKDEGVTIIDARASAAFQQEHIPGAVSLPHREMNEHSTKHLARELVYVCYCDGIGCNASTKGALNMARLGFKVKELMGGLDWWKRDGYATEGLQRTKGETTVKCAC